MPENFEMERSAIAITYRCSLKCKLCGAYAPYYKNPKHFTMEYLKNAIDAYFDVVTYVEKFVITGGEPFLHENLDELITYMFENYKGEEKRFGHIEIFTNGTIVPKSDLLKAMEFRGDALRVCVDDYGPNLSTKVQEIDRVFTERGINHKIRKYYGKDAHCGGWVDYSDLSQKHFCQKDIEEKFRKCAYTNKMQFCFIIKNRGEMHPCSPSYRCMELGITEIDEKEYIDLFDRKTSVEEKRMKIKRILESDSLRACAFCNGLCEDSERFAPAEQMV